MKFFPQNGTQVIVTGRVSLYEKGGTYQIIVSAMEPAGLGEQQRRLRELTEKLKAEGLFDEARKRPLPVYPSSIAVITSRDTAALQDIIKVISRRWPSVRLILCHTSVQGIYAEDEIAEALRLAAKTGADTAIITRGGGSTEDLFVFNSEKIVRAAATLPMPLISAVGHETDTTLIDLVSDRRAPTPSAAAEIAVPDREAVRSELLGAFLYMRDSLNAGLLARKNMTVGLARETAGLAESYLAEIFQRSDSAAQEHLSMQDSYLSALQEKLAAAAAITESVSPLAVLARGYTRVVRGGRTVSSARELSAGDEFTVCFRDGSVEAEVR